jgi:hypothetical protein
VNWVASMFVTIMALRGSRLTYSMTKESLPWTRISIARRIASTTTWEGCPDISGYGSSFSITCSSLVRLMITWRMVLSCCAIPSVVTGVTKYSGMFFDSTRIMVPERYLRGATIARSRASARKARKGIQTWRG